ncbi:hypothetical protein GF322_05275 [Candidatus Dependentiae bacterium]|nr:hypothetical protein [Candidatus Dependentiae bacterium]
MEIYFSKIFRDFIGIGEHIQEQSKLYGMGFESGFIFGIALGLIWTPCAGPILATVTTFLAVHSYITLNVFLVTLAYSLGSVLTMFLIIYGGNKAFRSIGILYKHTIIIRKIFGILIISGAISIAFHLDIFLQQILFEYFPMILVEKNKLIKQELDKFRRTAFASTVLIKF